MLPPSLDYNAQPTASTTARTDRPVPAARLDALLGVEVAFGVATKPVAEDVLAALMFAGTWETPVEYAAGWRGGVSSAGACGRRGAYPRCQRRSTWPSRSRSRRGAS